MNVPRGIGILIGLATTIVLDRWRRPSPVYGYSSLDFYGDN